jgi:Right handed beta helix region
MSVFSIPGVFNVLDFRMATNTGGGDPVLNAGYLQNAINAAQASGNPSGAIILIPSYSLSASGENAYGYYPLDTSGAPITISGNVPLLICGTGEGTELRMQAGNATDMFVISSAADVVFQDLTIRYDDVLSNQGLLGTAFTFTGAAAHKLFRIDLVNCQYPVSFQDTKHARMLQCYFKYNITTPASEIKAVEITAASEDTAISRCLFRCQINVSQKYYGIFVDQATGVKITDTQVEDFAVGILIQASQGNTEQISVVGARAQSYYQCVQVSAPVSDLTVTDVSFVDCHFEAATNALGGPGITVGTMGETNDQIDTVRFMSCSLTDQGSPQIAYGLQIGAGQNIQVHGGDYSGNGPTAGIAIVGGATAVQIIGANCVGLEYESDKESPPLQQLYGIEITDGTDIQIIGVNCSANGLSGDPGSDTNGYGIYINGSLGSGTVSDVLIIGVSCAGTPTYAINQEAGICVQHATGTLVHGCALNGSFDYGLYLGTVTGAIVKACDLFGNDTGLYIDSDSTQIYVRDCNASGYSTLSAAIYVYETLTAVEIANCAGYNDAYLPPLATSAPSGQFSGISVANYYGPTVFYHHNGGAVTIDEKDTYLSSGEFTLAPGENAQIGASLPGATFLMIGN